MARMVRMLTEAEVTDLLSVKKLPLPAHPKINDIKIEERLDWTGEEMLDIYLILDDASPEEDWKLPKIHPVTDLVRETLRNAGDSRFALFTIGTQKDYDERYTYDPSSDD
jgi:hypothetical protein